MSKKLKSVDKALYRAVIAKHHSIVNEKLVGTLLALIAKLLETSGARVFRRGLKKAVEMLDKGEEVFVWAPGLKDCLRDPMYISWLGTVR